MSHSVRSHLRLDIEVYDATIRRFIPGYEEMVATAADAVAQAKPGRVLDLGAGTGALAAAVLERTRTTVVELMDIDEEMLGQAQQRLRAFKGRTEHTLLSFDETLPPCDAVMASLSLHHIPTLDRKAALFKRIHAALPPGGVFVNADVTMAAGDKERARAFEGWADHLMAHGIRKKDALGHFEAWADEDTYFPLEEELAAVRTAGFQAECVWQQGVSTVVVARKTD